MPLLRRLLLIALLALGPVAGSSLAHADGPPPVTASDRVMGRADAPVTVVEYASFTCPHCGHWQTGVLPAFKARFIDTGRVRLVFRDLPTNPQNFSTAAALMGRCAAPDRFFDVATSFFSEQEILFAGGGRMWFDNAIAQSGLTRDQMNACFQDPAKKTALDADVNAAVLAGVTGTPTFFVNGRKLAGDPTLDNLAAAVAAAGH